MAFILEMESIFSFFLFITSRQQWVDVMGNHVSFPITIVDNRKNKFNCQYKITVVRKGETLYENVFAKMVCNWNRFSIRRENINLNLISKKLAISMWLYSLKMSINRLFM